MYLKISELRFVVTDGSLGKSINAHSNNQSFPLCLPGTITKTFYCVSNDKFIMVGQAFFRDDKPFS